MNRTELTQVILDHARDPDNQFSVDEAYEVGVGVIATTNGRCSAIFFDRAKFEPRVPDLFADEGPKDVGMLDLTGTQGLRNLAAAARRFIQGKGSGSNPAWQPRPVRLHI